MFFSGDGLFSSQQDMTIGKKRWAKLNEKMKLRAAKMGKKREEHGWVVENVVLAPTCACCKRLSEILLRIGNAKPLFRRERSPWPAPLALDHVSLAFDALLTTTVESNTSCANHTHLPTSPTQHLTWSYPLPCDNLLVRDSCSQLATTRRGGPRAHDARRVDRRG